MAFAPRNSKPPERPRDLRPIKGGGKSASAPLRGAFFPLPGAGASPTRALAPRKQLPSGGRTLSSRVYVLVSQVSHVTPQVQHTAIQELALLASTSDASRLEILAAGGDKQLIKMASRCEEAQLLRWALAVLVSLAADDWSRQRQQKMLPRLVALLAGTDEVVAKEAAVLAANLVTNANMLEAMHRLGGMSRLEEVAARNLDDPRLQSVNGASGATEGAGSRAPLPMISPGKPNPSPNPNPNPNPHPHPHPHPHPNPKPYPYA